MNVYSVTFCMIFIGHFQVYSTFARRLCDMRIWYLNLIANDVFHTALTKQQQELKDSIESLVLNVSDKPESRLKDCHVLEMYNDILKETFDFDSTTAKHMRDYEVRETESKDTDDAPKQRDTNEVNNGKASETHNSQTEDEIQPLDSETVAEKPDSNVLDIESSDTDEDTEDDTEDKSDEDEGNNSDEGLEDIETEDEIDETELFDDGDDTDLPDEDEDTPQQNTDILPSETIFTTNNTTTTRDKPGIRPIPLGVCWSFWCFKYEIFGPLGTYIMSKTPQTDKADTINKVDTAKTVEILILYCHSKTICYTFCHLYYAKSHCMLDYDNSSFMNPAETIKDNEMQEENMVDSGSKDTEYDKNMLVDQFKEDNVDNKNKVSGETSSKSTIIKQGNGAIIEDLVIENEENKLPLQDIDERKDTVKNIQVKTNVKDIEAEHMQMSDTGSKEEHSVNTRETQNGISLDEFEKLIQQKTGDYAHKIQTLELMIVNLEKQLLLEQLNKQNHSSSYTRLENIVLKLENDLLRMNKYYQNLKEESEAMHKQQNHYLELAYKQEKEKKYLELPDKSTENFELITKHQSKIAELSEILKNQSSLITQLKHRHDSLEEQNRMLHQMVMNQTIFMTSIIQTVQDLSEQNSKNRQDMYEMKQKLDSALNKKQQLETDTGTPKQTSMLETLESFASDTAVKSQYTEEDKSLQSSKDYIAMEDFLMKWCPANNETCPACFYNSIMIPNCIPYRTLFWSRCKGACKTLKTFLPKSPDVEDIRSKDTAEKVQLQEGSDNRQKESSRTINIDTMDMAKIDIQSEKDNGILQNTQSDTETENKNQKNSDGSHSSQDSSKEINEDSSEKVEGQLHPGQIGQTSETSENNMDSNNKNAETKNDYQEKSKPENKNSVQHQLESPDEESKSEKYEEITKHSQSDKEKQHPGNENTKDSNMKDADKKTEKVSDEKAKSETSTNQNVKTSQVHKDKAPAPAESGTVTNKANSMKVKASDENANTNTDSAQKGKTSKSEKTVKSAVEAKRKEPINLGKAKQKEPKDCYEIYTRGKKGDGIYKIRPLGSSRVIDVFCDIKKGGWTVIQKRQDGKTDFFLGWEDYKKGFGGLYGEHYIGNDALHFLTNQDYYKLRVELIDWDKNKRYAEFGFFLVDSEDEGYRLHIEDYSGDAGDGFTKHKGSKFSTKDVDNDKVVKEFGGSCANRFHGAGWYYKCYASNLNGKYYNSGKIPEKMFDGITWKPWTGPNYSLKKVVMKVRPASAVERT